MVSEYTYEESVRDGVNVPFEVYEIKTLVTQQGGRIASGFDVSRRDKLTRAQRMALNEEDVVGAFGWHQPVRPRLFAW